MKLRATTMTGDNGPIDELLACALRGESAAWPSTWHESEQARPVLERIAYHGIAGLIAEKANSLHDWPVSVLSPVRDQAVALAMWELRHKQLICALLAALATAGIPARLLKGTALAYDLYPAPASRARGDTDLLISPTGLAQARSILARLGFQRPAVDERHSDDIASQEDWSFGCDAGTTHQIDLHWRLLDAVALRGLSFTHCDTGSNHLSRLGPDAMAMTRVMTLLHTCIHRAMHLTSPYFVNGRAYYGGDRLVWAKDIDLLSGALNDREWHQLTRMALDQGVARVCLEGLRMAERSLRTKVPLHVIDALDASSDEAASAYLLDSRQLGRAWRDLQSVRGWNRKLAYLASRVLPSEGFMRRKYPGSSRSLLILLHVRRLIDLVRTRPDARAGR